MRYVRRPAAVLPQPSGSGTYSQRTDGCPCTGNDFLTGMPPAMAYVPWQKWQNIYNTERGFQRGTIFQDLDKPFLWKGGRCR